MLTLWKWNMSSSQCHANRQIDVDDKGSLDKATVITALQQSGTATYDQARETLKSTSVDASGKVELEDWVQLHSLLKQGAAEGLVDVIPTSLV